MEKPTALLLVTGDADLGQRVRRALSREELYNVVAVVGDPLEAVQMALATLPDVAVIADCAGFPWADMCNIVRLACPSCWMILLTTQAADRCIADTAMMVGVRQVIPLSDDFTDIERAIEKLQSLENARDTEEYLRATDPQMFPRVVAISGAKGGVGKTTIAVNLAVALAAKNVGKVVVWDAYSQFGDVANIMGLSPIRVLAELADLKGEDVDESLILNYVIHHDSGTDVLLTSVKPVRLDLLSAELTAHVIHALRRKYRFIVVDVPPILDAVSRTIFADCWRLLIITTLKDVTSLSDAMKLIEVLEPEYVKGGAIGVVANRVVKGDAMKEGEVESLTGKKVAAMVPEDPGVGQANNLGKPICLATTSSPAAKAILALGDSVIRSASSFAVDPLGRSD